MKILILLQAVSSKRAYRNYLKVYERIELLERGKLMIRRTYIQRSGNKERETITCFSISESSGIVPLKFVKASGGIATSQLNKKKYNYTIHSGSSKTKRSQTLKDFKGLKLTGWGF